MLLRRSGFSESEEVDKLDEYILVPLDSAVDWVETKAPKSVAVKRKMGLIKTINRGVREISSKNKNKKTK